jgi:sugar/nucleoside kinase (ribokinase family)
MTERVVVVGDIATDVLTIHSGPIAAGSDTPARIHLTGGGSAANTAAWLACRGVPVTLVGVVGTDEAGRNLVAELTEAGVHCAVRHSTRAQTGTVVVLSDAAERSMLCDRGANRLLATTDVAIAITAEVGHVHVSGYTLLGPDSREAGLHALAAPGVTRSVDAASAAPLRRAGAFLDWVRGADLLLANLDEARVLTGGKPAPAAELAVALTQVVCNVVVKCGAEGAVWASADGEVAAVAARPVPVTDPTGAGDAFAAGLLAAWLKGADREAALRAGAELGAQAVTIVGGRPVSS